MFDIFHLSQASDVCSPCNIFLKISTYLLLSSSGYKPKISSSETVFSLGVFLFGSFPKFISSGTDSRFISDINLISLLKYAKKMPRKRFYTNSQLCRGWDLNPQELALTAF